MELRHRLGGYLEFRPPEACASVVESVWIHRAPAHLPPDPAWRHRVLPDPAIGIAFACSRAADSTPLEPQLFVIGPVTGTREFVIVPGFEMVAVKIKLEWARQLGLDPWDHANRVDPASDIHPRWASDLLDALVATGSATGALTILQEAVSRRAALRSLSSENPVGPWAMERVRHAGGNVDLTGLASESGFSDRHVRRSVLARAGISPKRYARTLRLLSAITSADALERPSWARIAAEAGFTDQSHLIRDCRSLTGHTPEQLFRERRRESEISNPRRA